MKTLLIILAMTISMLSTSANALTIDGHPAQLIECQIVDDGHMGVYRVYAGYRNNYTKNVFFKTGTCRSY